MPREFRNTGRMSLETSASAGAWGIPEEGDSTSLAASEWTLGEGKTALKLFLRLFGSDT